MAETSIEWTATRLPDGRMLPGYTFNPWQGCVKVSPACTNCYAAVLGNRFGVEWGPKARRRFQTEGYWTQPHRWNAQAEKAGIRRKVFCASMADVFELLDEVHPDHSAMAQARQRLWSILSETPHLDWLLLTKRPDNVLGMTPADWDYRTWPANVWIGSTVETQEQAEKRIPHLLEVPAKVRFLSCEPLLGPVDLTPWLRIAWQCSGCRGYFPDPYREVCPDCGREGYWSGSHRFNPPGGQRGSGAGGKGHGGSRGPLRGTLRCRGEHRRPGCGD